MEHRYLGDTGLAVSELCLGTMTFGAETDEPTARQILDGYADAGGLFIDTADVYAGTRSEQIVGRWLEQRRREDFVVATKAYVPTGPGPNQRGLSRKYLLAAVDASLRRLRTDYIDLYQVHLWDAHTPLTETLSTLDTLVRAGKVRYLGASNYCGWQLQKAISLAGQHGWEPFRSLQPLYNLLDRQAELELIPVCQREGLGVIPWAPLRTGWLAGRYHRGMAGPPEGSRAHTAERNDAQESWANYANERTWRVLDEVNAVAAETGRMPAQVSLRWLLQRQGVTAPIVGARTVNHLRDNLGACGWTLTEAQLDRLTKAGDPDGRLPYPHDVIAQYGR